MRWFGVAILSLWALSASACGSGGDAAGGDGEEEVQVDEDLGSIKIMNSGEEPVAIFLDGQELFTIAPGRSYTFRNIPVGPATIYGVGRVTEKHYGLPELTIEEGGDYEWTIRQ